MVAWRYGGVHIRAVGRIAHATERTKVYPAHYPLSRSDHANHRMQRLYTVFTAVYIAGRPQIHRFQHLWDG